MKNKNHQGERQKVCLAVTEERKKQLTLCDTFPLYLFQLLHKGGLNIRQKRPVLLCSLDVMHLFSQSQKKCQIIVFCFVFFFLVPFSLGNGIYYQREKRNRAGKPLRNIQRMGLKFIT